MARKRGIKLYQQNSATWWCEFRDHHGKRIRRSTHQTLRALAEAAAKRLVEEHPALPEPNHACSLEGALSHYLSPR